MPIATTMAMRIILIALSRILLVVSPSIAAMPPKLTPSVLIIDDSQEILQIASAALATWGYRIYTAEDIAAAIWTAASRERVLDLVICDCFVDQQTGLEVMEAIRSLPRCAEIPAMFMSSHQTPDVILRRYQSTGSYHIKKPLDIELLLEIADRSLWMPHLVKSHIQKQHDPHAVSAPHAPFGSVSYPTNVNSSSFAN